MTDAGSSVQSEALSSMLATVEEDWELLAALPPQIPSEQLSLGEIEDAYEVLHERHITARQTGESGIAARTAFWLGSLQLDRARHPDTSATWSEEYFSDSLIYLNRATKGHLRRRTRAMLLASSIELQQRYVEGQKPTKAVLDTYNDRIAQTTIPILENNNRTKEKRTNDLIDVALPLFLLRSGDVVPYFANARELCDIPTRHPELSSQAHHYYLLEDERKIIIKGVFHGRHGRALSTPGQLAHICFQSISMHHLAQHHPNEFARLDGRGQTINTSFQIISWAVRDALRLPIRREERATVNAVSADILGRVREVVDGSVVMSPHRRERQV